MQSNIFSPSQISIFPFDPGLNELTDHFIQSVFNINQFLSNIFCMQRCHIQSQGSGSETKEIIIALTSRKS